MIPRPRAVRAATSWRPAELLVPDSRVETEQRWRGTEASLKAGTSWASQVGTTSQCHNGIATYYAFSRLQTAIPGQGSQVEPFDTMTIRADDHVSAKVNYVETNAGGEQLYNVSISDPVRDENNYSAPLWTTEAAHFADIAAEGAAG